MFYFCNSLDCFWSQIENLHGGYKTIKVKLVTAIVDVYVYTKLTHIWEVFFKENYY